VENQRPGDVVDVPAGKYSGFAVVIDPGVRSDREGPRPYVLTLDRHARRLSMVDFPTPVSALTRLKVPRNFNGRDAQARRDLAQTLHLRTRDLPPKHHRGAAEADGGGDREVEELRSRLRAHPCHSCPDREDHARWSERWYKLHRDSQTLRRRIEQRTNTIARRFDRICEVLTELDYLTEQDGTTTVTAKGQRLMRIYAELDLVASEAIEQGLWNELSPSGLAAALSSLVYESRRADDAASPRVPGGAVKQALAETVRLWGDLEALQREHKIEFSREPDLAFAWAAYRWAEGDDLDEVLDATGLAAGDFVRWVKQLVDLAGQVADAAGGSSPLRATARETVALLRRGVVAYSSVST
jgi:ATP-dependent RNA helicase HelY